MAESWHLYKYFFIVPFQIHEILIVQSLGDGGYLQSYGFATQTFTYMQWSIQ